MMAFMIFLLAFSIVAVIGVLAITEDDDQHEPFKVETMQEYCDRKFNHRG